MSGPLLLAENFASTICFPGHTIVGDEEAGGHEAFHVADGRRSLLAGDYWTGITANQQRTLTITFDRVRAFNCAFLDRGHNLPGLPLFIEPSMDSVNWQLAASPTIPTANLALTLSNANGVTTEEGAWGILFPTVAGAAARIRIPAMGTGLTPIIVGLWLGLAYQPANNFVMPWSEDADQLLVNELVSEWGWRGRGPIATPNTGFMNTKLLTDDEYDLARYQMGGHFGRGRPTWICYDQAQADRSFLAIRLQGEFNYSFQPNWFPRQARIPYVEHEPVRMS